MSAIVSDPAWKAYFQSIAPNGHVSPFTKIQSPKSLLDTRELTAQLGAEAVKTLIYTGSSTAGGALVFSTQRPDIVAPVPGFGRLGIADLVTRIPVGSDLVEWIRITGVTNNAAIVAEASATGDTSGTKPESAMAFERVSTPIEVVAHWIPATTRILSDARQLRGYIDAFLRRGLERALDVQIVQGDGTGDNFDGILNQAGILTQAFDTNLLITTRKAITNIQVNWQVGDPTEEQFLLVGYGLVVPGFVAMVLTALAVRRSRVAGADEVLSTLPAARRAGPWPTASRRSSPEPSPSS